MINTVFFRGVRASPVSQKIYIFPVEIIKALVYYTNKGFCARMKSALPLKAQIIFERCATTLNVALNDI